MIPSQHSTDDQPLQATSQDSHPESEMQEISEDEFLDNVDAIHRMVTTCSQLKIPKSVRKYVDGLLKSVKKVQKCM